MANNNFYARIQQKIDTEENWNKAVNFVPLKGEIIIYDTDSAHDYKRIKIGDGVTTVINLEFVADINDLGAITVDIEGATEGIPATVDADTLGGKTPEQLTFGADQIITDIGTDKRLLETLEEKMDKSGGDFWGHLTQAKGFGFDFATGEGYKLRLIGDGSANYAFLQVTQADGTWIADILKINTVTGAIEGGVLMPKSGSAFTGDAVHFNNYRANVGSYYGSNTDHNAHLATVGEDGLISQICVDNNMTAYAQQWKDGQYIKGATIMTDAGGYFTGEVRSNNYTSHPAGGFFRNIEIWNSANSAQISTGLLHMVRK